MSFKIVSSRLTASPNSLGWSQVHEFTPQDSNKFKARGRLFAVISVKRLDEGNGKGQVIDSVSAGREVLSRLHEEYFGKVTESSFETLKSAVEKVVAEFRNGQSVIEIAAVVQVSSVIYAAATGGAQLIIFRDGNLATILTSRGKEVVTASGYPKEGDVLTLGTSAFFKSFSEGVIRGALEGSDVRKAAESFAPKVHASGANPDLGVAFLKFNKTSDDEAVFKEISSKRDPLMSKETAGRSSLGEGQSLGMSSLTQDKLAQGSQAQQASISKWKNIYINIAKLAGLKGKGMYVKESEEPLENKKRRKVSASVGILLVLILIVSVFFGIKQKKNKDYRLQYESELKEAEHLLDESLNLYTIDTNRSRELFNQARSIVDSLLVGGIEDLELDSLKNKIQVKQGEILGEYETQLDSFSDLTIITSGFIGKSIVGYNEEIYVLDQEGEKIVSISVAAKKSKVVVGPAQLSGVKDFAVYSDKVYVINEDGIFEVTKTLKDEVAEKDWSGEVMLFAYTSNLYLLEKDAGDISRFTSTDSGFAERKSWIAESTSVDLTGSIDWVIDGTIWVLREGGEINRFSLGNPLTFSIKGLAPELTNGNAIYTDENIENLYLLDSVGKRVVVTDKEGNFKAQYLAEDLSGAKDIVVSESQGKIIILKEGKLLSIELKHL